MESITVPEPSEPKLRKLHTYDEYVYLYTPIEVFDELQRLKENMVTMVTLLNSLQATVYPAHYKPKSYFYELFVKNNELVLEKQKLIVPWINYMEDQFLQENEDLEYSPFLQMTLEKYRRSRTPFLQKLLHTERSSKPPPIEDIDQAKLWAFGAKKKVDKKHKVPEFDIIEKEEDIKEKEAQETYHRQMIFRMENAFRDKSF